MLPVPDFRGVTAVLWAVMAVPCLLGLVVIFLAGCTGVETGQRIKMTRYLVAISVSGILGGLLFVATLALCLWTFGFIQIDVFPTPWQFLGVLLLIIAVAALGAIASYRTGRLMIRILVR